MITDVKPYPAMKDSGVPWLAQVPKHWEVRRLRNVAEMRVSNVDKHTKVDEQPVRLCNYVDVYKHDRIRSRMNFMRATATADEVERFRLRIGDVLITKDSETWNDIGVPALVEDASDDLICGYHLALLRARKEVLNSAYLLRALQSPAVAYQFHVAANGVTRYGLSHGAIKSVRIPLPPLSEQAAIVQFLDFVDNRLSRTVHTLRRLAGGVRFMQERRASMLFELRTRLMADIVTGKLDVREAAQNLPDEEVRLESLDETEVSDEEGSLTDSDGLEPEESEA